jgi:hypothetical protein
MRDLGFSLYKIILLFMLILMKGKGASWYYYELEANLMILQFLCSGLTFFRQNNYGVQFVFFFAYMNLQISFAFLMTTYFSSVRTATGMLLLMCALYPFYQIV